MQLNIPNKWLYVAGGFLLGIKTRQVNYVVCNYLDYKSRQIKEDERPINIMGDVIE